jgi:hypothetical protein
MIVGYRFVVAGAHVYYEVAHTGVDGISFYRARLDASAPPEKIIDTAPFGVNVSPDGRTVAWVESYQNPLRWSLVITDIATGARRAYPLPEAGDHVTWSPSGRSVVIDPKNSWTTAGTPLQWVDLSTGSVRVWLEPRGDIDVLPTRDIGWDGESPIDYVTGADLSRYFLATGVREQLATLAIPGEAIGWSADFTTATIQSSECLKWSGGIFGASCLQWSSRVERIAWKSGTRTPVLRFVGPAPIFGRSAPSGPWLAYEYGACGGGCYAEGDGLYFMRTP